MDFNVDVNINIDIDFYIDIDLSSVQKITAFPNRWRCKQIAERKNETKYAPRAPKTPPRARVETTYALHTPCPFELFYPITERDAKALSGTL